MLCWRCARVGADWKASARVMEKCGFSFEGTIKEKYEFKGELHDNSWFGLRLADVEALPDGTVQEIKEP